MKFEKKYIALILAFVISVMGGFGLHAATDNATYQIMKLNTPTITIGGKTLKVGDRFSGASTIKWNDDKQKMEVKQISGENQGQTYLFSKKVMDSKGAILSIADFFLRTNKASSRVTGETFKLKKSPVANRFPEKRIALVIGNSNYYNLSYLRNAQKDASDVADVLLSLGFDVLEAYETNFEELHTALNQFSELAKGYDAAMFYFAGHGLQDEGKNYLIPINAKLQYRSELRDFLHGDDVLQRMSATRAPTQLIFIDACRNAKSVWERSSSEGLARMEGGPGAVIVFSTESGKVALDGEGENSPFAAALIKNLKLKKNSFLETLNSVVRDTYEATNHKQYPLQMGTPLTDFNFNPPSVAPKVQTTTPAVTHVDAEALNNQGLTYYNSQNYGEAMKYFRQAAEAGNASAQFNLGLLYDKGYGTTQNYAEAAKWYRMAAEKGNVSAQSGLGYLYYNGKGVAKDNTEALKWYRLAAEKGNSAALNNLALMYERGEGVNKDLNEALRLYQKAVDAGSETARKNLELLQKSMAKPTATSATSASVNSETLANQGISYFTSKNYAEALKYLRQAADLGNASAQHYLGYMYEEGLGVAQNYSEALRLYRLSANQGFSSAQNNLGYMYEWGHGVGKNEVEAFNWYRKAALQGDKVAQNNVAYLFETGRGVIQNYEEAAKWYRISADQGYASAQNSLGTAYENGRGVPQSYTEAFKWFKLAADQGYPKAENTVGYYYDEGLGVEQNYPEAMKWYKKAADHGNYTAMNNIGFLYHNGKGVTRNYDEALWWYEKAIAAGSETAKKNLEELKEDMAGTKITSTPKNTLTHVFLMSKESSEPLIGASVIHLRNGKTINSMVSDIDGNFTVKDLKNGDILRLSCIGFKNKEVTVEGDNSAMIIKLSQGDQRITEYETLQGTPRLSFLLHE